MTKEQLKHLFPPLMEIRKIEGGYEFRNPAVVDEVDQMLSRRRVDKASHELLKLSFEVESALRQQLRKMYYEQYQQSSQPFLLLGGVSGCLSVGEQQRFKCPYCGMWH